MFKTRCLALLTVLALLCALLPAAALAEPVEVVKIYTVGGQPAGWPQVEEAINARTREEIGIEIDVTFAGWDNYGSKLQMELAAGEQYHWVYDAAWCALAANLAAGYYMPLDDLIAQYAPTLLAMKTQTVLDANKNPGPDGVYRLYTLPNISACASSCQAFVRKDIREALGYPEITTYEQLIDFMYKVKEAYPDMTPIAPSATGGYLSQVLFAMNCQLDKTPQYVSMTALSEDGVIFMQGNDGRFYNIFDDMPEAMSEAIAQARQMYLDGVIDPDCMTGTTENFWQGTQAVLYKLDIGVNGDLVQGLKAIEPDAQVEAVNFYDYEHAGQVVSDFKAKDFLCMPITCPNPEAAMRFLEWLCQSQENYDLITSGIQGLTWEPVGDKQYTYNSDLWEWLSWRYFRLPQYERLDANFTEHELDIIVNNWGNPDWFTRSVTTGFGYDPSGVQTEISILNAAMAQYWYAILDGAIDPEEGMAAFRAAAYDAVIAIEQDMQAQPDAFLAQ
ncbi:MAG: extracellular solute-binding protein [Aristaeellaceae bacterium]